MRCPRCQDEYEPHVRRCAECGIELAPEGAPPPPPPADARLGRFDPAVADLLLGILDGRGIGHETLTDDDGVTLLVPEEHRHDLRAELITTWPDLLDELPEAEAEAVRRRGGEQPGWLDAPQGTWIDRAGRMVVETAEDEAGSRGRAKGPVLAASGALLVLLAWYAELGSGFVFLGIGVAIVGVLLPR